MITIKENKLNLVFGDVDSAKTTLIINEIIDNIDDEKEVLFFTPDTKDHHIEKKIHCLVNDVDMASVKHDRKTLKPTNLVLPNGLQVIGECRDFEDIKRTIREFKLAGRPDLIVIDNINQVNFGIKLPYKERISKIFTILSDLAENEKLTILASFYMLKSANWDHDDDFTENDEKLGSLVLVQRNDKIVEVFDESSGNVLKFNIDPRNLKLVDYKKNLPTHLMN